MCDRLCGETSYFACYPIDTEACGFDGECVMMKKEVISQTPNDLYSVLDVPKEQSKPVRLQYPSFRGHLLRKDRVQRPRPPGRREASLSHIGRQVYTTPIDSTQARYLRRRCS
jgi:hypothetical protein